MKTSQYKNRAIGTRYGRYDHFINAPVKSREIGATIFCLFLKTQDFIKKSMYQSMLKEFIDNMEQTDFDSKNVFVHASYDLNLCEWNQRLRTKLLGDN